MGWNEPKNGKDPWGSGSQPPDLDEALKRFTSNLRKLFAKPKSSETSSDKGPGRFFVPPESGIKGTWFALMMAGIIVLLWAISGIFIVDPAEQAAILRFGRYIRTVGPGPHWIPRMIDSKIVLNVDRVADYSYSAQMLTKDENLVSVAVAVQYRIGDLQDYLFNVSDAEESLQQATSSALRQVVGTTTLDQLITEGRDAWGSSVQDSLVKILASYRTGIIIVNVSPQPARAPENVQDAFDDAIKAQEDEKRFKEQAGAYAARVIPIAEGNAVRITEEAKAYAQQVVLKATGETSGFLQLLPEYEKAPFVLQKRMYLDTMARVLQQSTKILVNGKSGQMLYLPLDKMIATDAHANQAPQSGQPEVMTPPEPATSSEHLVLDGRSVTRSVSQPGRTDS